MTALRAALNAALEDGYVQNALAWKEPLKAMKADGRRNLYLDRNQRRSLLEHISDEARPFVTALCLLPVRPGALAALRVTGRSSPTHHCPQTPIPSSPWTATSIRSCARYGKSKAQRSSSTGSRRTQVRARLAGGGMTHPGSRASASSAKASRSTKCSTSRRPTPSAYQSGAAIRTPRLSLKPSTRT